MSEEQELFPGQHSAPRDDVEGRLAASTDPLVRFIMPRFAQMSDLLNRHLVKVPQAERHPWIERTLELARAKFDLETPHGGAVREAYPLEWFNNCIKEARHG